MLMDSKEEICNENGCGRRFFVVFLVAVMNVD
jgi:hypothetical protein